MKTEHLKLLKVVAEEGSLTAAVDRLHRTQPALSRQLKELEREAGLPLFKRIGKRMVLSEAGKRTLDSADKVLTELDQLHRDLDRMSKPGACRVRLAVGCLTCYRWLPGIIKSIRQEYPEFELEFDVDATENPVASLLSGKLDLAVVSMPPDNANVISEPLFNDEVSVVVSSDHPWAEREYVDIDQFASENLIAYPRPITAVQRILDQAEVSPRKVTRIQLTEAAMEMVRAGLGVAVFANWVSRPYLEQGGLATVRLSEDGLCRTWYGVTLKEDADNPCYRVVKEHLRSLAGHQECRCE